MSYVRTRWILYDHEMKIICQHWIINSYNWSKSWNQWKIADQSWRVAMRSSSLYKKNLQKRRNTQWKSLKLNSQRNNIEQVKNIYSFSPSFTWVPPNSGKRTLSPSLTETGIRFPVLSLAPGPTAITLPEFSWVQSNPSNFMFFDERIGSREALYLRRCFR